MTCNDLRIQLSSNHVSKSDRILCREPYTLRSYMHIANTRRAVAPPPPPPPPYHPMTIKLMQHLFAHHFNTQHGRSDTHTHTHLQAERSELEYDQPHMLKLVLVAIMDLLFTRKNKVMSTVASKHCMDELTKQLSDNGFNIYRGGVYFRPIPKRSSSLEGKRHVTTVKLKLIRVQNVPRQAC